MKSVNADELKEMLSRDVTLINTLPEKSFNTTKIPGAINIPQDAPDFVQRVEKAVGGRSAPVVVYCASQQCDSSTKAAQKLEAAGFSDVSDFESGAQGWREAGEELAASVT